MKKKQSFSWGGLGLLLAIVFFPLVVIAEILKTTGKPRRRSGVMCGPGGSRRK